jgi:hypothetical protein
MEKLYLVYGIPKGQSERHEEVLLLSKGKSEADQDKVITAASKDGFHGFRKTTHTDGAKPDFAGTVGNKKIKWT